MKPLLIVAAAPVAVGLFDNKSEKMPGKGLYEPSTAGDLNAANAAFTKVVENPSVPLSIAAASHVSRADTAAALVALERLGRTYTAEIQIIVKASACKNRGTVPVQPLRIYWRKP